MATVKCSYAQRCLSKKTCPHAKPHKWTSRCDADQYAPCGHGEQCVTIRKRATTQKRTVVREHTNPRWIIGGMVSHYGINLSFDISHKWQFKEIDKCVDTLVKDIKRVFNDWKRDFKGMGVKNVKWE